MQPMTLHLLRSASKSSINRLRHLPIRIVPWKHHFFLFNNVAYSQLIVIDRHCRQIQRPWNRTTQHKPYNVLQLPMHHQRFRCESVDRHMPWEDSDDYDSSSIPFFINIITMPCSLHTQPASMRITVWSSDNEATGDQSPSKSRTEE